MRMPRLPANWEPTRLSLQRYAQAITALPRAGAEHDDRWTHVSLRPVHLADGGTGFSSAPTVLGNGAKLVSTLDVHRDRIAVAVGSKVETIDLLAGPSPQSIGSLLADLAATHGSELAIDEARYSDDSAQVYDRWQAHAWHDNTMWVAETLSILNTGIDGETSGPHIWPHGFDIATEWFGAKRVGEGDDAAHAQIAVGFYPAGDPYFYANPWPFDDSWADADLPEGVHWHVDGWYGAVLPAAELAGIDDREQVLEYARRVHEIAHRGLS